MAVKCLKNEMKKILIFLVGIMAFVSHAAFAQVQPKDKQLYQTIAQMDSVMFGAFNRQDLDVLKTVFATDLEFYNDGGGVTGYQETINNFKAMFARNKTSNLRRELVPGTLEVYPVPGFGAIEVATHRFIHTENGKEEVGTLKFVQTWRYKDGKWQATRVISLGH